MLASRETAMRKILLSAMVASLVLAGSVAYGMTADDIIDLCKAGFTPQRIAKIVDATGLDRPLVAADWARIRNDGCDDRVVDALLDVLVPADGDASEASIEDDDDESGETRSNINVYLRSNWGWDGWYGGFSYGWYDPFWSVGWTSWDPYWGWSGWGYPSYWYANDWWGYPYRHRFGCGPYFYHSHWYDGGYYASGRWERHKDHRRSSRHGSYYADHKTPETVQRGLMTKAVAFQTSASSSDRSYGLRSKGSATSPTGTISKGTGTDRGYTTRSKTSGTGLTTREQLRSKNSGGAVTTGKSTTGASRYGTVKTRSKSSDTAPSGTGSQGTYTRQRPKSSGGTTATPPATTTTKQKSTPPPAPAGNDGGKGSIKRDAGSSGGTTQSTPKLKGKG